MSLYNMSYKPLYDKLSCDMKQTNGITIDITLSSFLFLFWYQDTRSRRYTKVGYIQSFTSVLNALRRGGCRDRRRGKIHFN